MVLLWARYVDSGGGDLPGGRSFSQVPIACPRGRGGGAALPPYLAIGYLSRFLRGIFKPVQIYQIDSNKEGRGGSADPPTLFWYAWDVLEAGGGEC